MKQYDLKGKTVLVTGAAKGIGKAIALAFAAEGANIVLNYRTGPEPPVTEQIREMGAACMALQGDVSSFARAEEMIKTAKERFGTLDVLVNNAGITRDGLLLRMKEADYDAVMDTNMKGVFNMTRHGLGVMLRQKRGAIINMASVVGEMGSPGQANYAASKAAVVGFTKAVAREVASKGITCNAIAPGFIETDMTAALPEKRKEQLLETIPAKAFGTAEDVARAAVFLAVNPYITGQVLNVDGGMVMQG